MAQALKIARADLTVGNGQVVVKSTIGAVGGRGKPRR